MVYVYTQMQTATELLQSTIRVNELISFLKKQQINTVAYTNTKMYGLNTFYKALTAENLRPVCGLTVQLAFTNEEKCPVILYAQNEQGYNHLVKISSAVSLREDESLPLKWLEGYKMGLKILIPSIETAWQDRQDSFLLTLHELFGEQLLVGIERPGGEKQTYEEAIVAYCKMHNLPIGATQKSTFLHKEDVKAYEVLCSIEDGIKLEDREPLTFREKNQYVLTKEQWTLYFEDEPTWLENAAQFLTDCHVNFAEPTFHMPKFPLAEDVQAADALREQCLIGLQQRVPNYTDAYTERLNYELSIIEQMGYADYFLIVADYIRYAKENQILTGPGRGSSASSLVAYTMRITDVDPLHYGLLFERFLNPERITLPDIDVDFSDYKRQQVIQYVAKKYGAKQTAQIITFGTLSAKAVARDTARIFGFSQEELSTISSFIPNKPGTTLKDTLAAQYGLSEWIAASAKRQQWIEVALRLEGLPRNASTHAAGVVLSPEPLVNIVPLEKGHDELFLTQWPMNEIEAIGLLKMDFLGLRNLTILDRIRQMIYFDQRRVLQFEKIPLNDTKTFELLRKGDTTGVFQLESLGMRQALREIQPTQFLDIVAVNALYRPGPMDFIPVYSRRKHGQEPVIMPHPHLTSILQETYGVIVYQEQIMQIAYTMAGFTFGEADLLRRAVSKKKREILDEERKHFVESSMQKGYSQEVANDVYDLIVRFADYGFPKSHAVAYSLISYQMAYLKANFPAYFYAAILTATMGNKEKFQDTLQEMKERNITLLPPSITKSGRTFRVENGAIRFALNGIKGVPNSFIEKIMRLRKNEATNWSNLFELALACSAVHFKEKTVEALIKAGALDEFSISRSKLLASIDGAVKHAKVHAAKEDDEVFYDSDIYGMPKYTTATIELTEKELLQAEKEVLGFYLSTHPVTKVKEQKGIVGMALIQVEKSNVRSYCQVVGQLRDAKIIRTKKGEQMAFGKLEDEHTVISITLFPQLFIQVKEQFLEDTIFFVEGMIEERNGSRQLIAKKIQVI